MSLEEIKNYDWSWVYAYLKEYTIFDTARMEEHRVFLINLAEESQQENVKLLEQTKKYQNALEEIAYYVSTPIGEDWNYENTVDELMAIAKRVLG